MTTKCPNCQSDRVVTKDYAKKTCGFLGMIGGAASGTTGTLAGAEIGGTIGIIGGPVGVTIGAIFVALVGAATGGIACAKLGELIDEKILDNYQCLACNYVFDQKSE